MSSVEQKEEYRQVWGSPSLFRVHNAVCEDGKLRTATVTGQPCTFFTIPARVKAAGKTVTGFLSVERWPRFEEETWIFTANKSGVNAGVIPVPGNEKEEGGTL